MEVRDNDLREFVRWYKGHYGQCEDTESVFVTCMCGHFHSYPKAMKEVLKRMVSLGLIKKDKEKIIIL